MMGLELESEFSCLLMFLHSSYLSRPSRSNFRGSGSSPPHSPENT